MQRAEPKDTIVWQQVEISELERKGFSNLSDPLPFHTMVRTMDSRKLDKPEDRRRGLQGKSKMEEREQEMIEGEEKETGEQGAKETTCHEVKRRGEEEGPSPLQPTLRWTVGRNSDPSRKIASRLQEGRRSLWDGPQGSDSTGKDEPSLSLRFSAPPFTPENPILSLRKLRRVAPRWLNPVRTTPLMKKGDDIDTPAIPSIVDTPTVSPRVPVTLEKSPFADMELRPSSPRPFYLSHKRSRAWDLP